MKQNLLYRQILAVILLMLYAFIAAPVQLWHHHKKVTTFSSAGTIAKLNGHSTVGVPTISSADDCSICAHKYSAYTDITFFIPPIFVNWNYLSFQVQDCLPLQQVIYHTDNRGPPAI